jgi:hypothetical protein
MAMKTIMGLLCLYQMPFKQLAAIALGIGSTPLAMYSAAQTT